MLPGLLLMGTKDTRHPQSSRTRFQTQELAEQTERISKFCIKSQYLKSDPESLPGDRTQEVGGQRWPLLFHSLASLLPAPCSVDTASITFGPDANASLRMLPFPSPWMCALSVGHHSWKEDSLGTDKGRLVPAYLGHLLTRRAGVQHSNNIHKEQLEGKRMGCEVF